jgi:hypothetical protein
VTELPYNVLDALAFAKATGHTPTRIRPETMRVVADLQTQPDVTVKVEHNRLYKAIRYLQAKGFTVDAMRSTVKEVILQSSDGMEAMATTKGEVIVGSRRETRFFNG